MKLQGITPSSAQVDFENEIKRLKEMLLSAFHEMDQMEAEIKRLMSKEEYEERLLQKSEKEFENIKAGKWE